jgi:hypothetical protein
MAQANSPDTWAAMHTTTNIRKMKNNPPPQFLQVPKPFEYNQYLHSWYRLHI